MKSFNYKTKQGNEYEVYVDLSVHYEPDYGADIDGNRGMPMYFVDDFEWEVDGKPSDEEMTEIQERVEVFVEDLDAEEYYWLDYGDEDYRTQDCED